MSKLSGTKWSVETMNDKAETSQFWNTNPWIFYDYLITCEDNWHSAYVVDSACPNTYHVQQQMDKGGRIDKYQIIVVTDKRFVGVINGSIFCFGSKIE